MAALRRNARHLNNVKRVWGHLGSTSSNIVTSHNSAASWHRELSGFQARPYSTNPRGILGFLGKDSLFPSRERTHPSAGNDYVVDTLDPSDDDDEDRRKPSHLVRAGNAKPDYKATEAAVDKGANVATSAMDNVGSVLAKTGLEVELDVSLQELTIEKLVLKDVGLVLVVKTKPQPPPGSQPEPEEPDTRERRVRPGSQPTHVSQ